MARALYVSVGLNGSEVLALFEAEKRIVTKIIKVAEGQEIEAWRGDFEDGQVQSMRGSYSIVVRVPDDHNTLEIPQATTDDVANQGDVDAG